MSSPLQAEFAQTGSGALAIVGTIFAVCYGAHKVDAKLLAMDAKFDGLKESVTKEVAGAKDELNAKMAGVKDEVDAKVAGVNRVAAATQPRRADAGEGPKPDEETRLEGRV